MEGIQGPPSQGSQESLFATNAAEGILSNLSCNGSSTAPAAMICNSEMMLASLLNSLGVGGAPALNDVPTGCSGSEALGTNGVNHGVGWGEPRSAGTVNKNASAAAAASAAAIGLPPNLLDDDSPGFGGSGSPSVLTNSLTSLGVDPRLSAVCGALQSGDSRGAAQAIGAHALLGQTGMHPDCCYSTAFHGNGVSLGAAARDATAIGPGYDAGSSYHGSDDCSTAGFDDRPTVGDRYRQASENERRNSGANGSNCSNSCSNHVTADSPSHDALELAAAMKTPAKLAVIHNVAAVCNHSLERDGDFTSAQRWEQRQRRAPPYADLLPGYRQAPLPAYLNCADAVVVPASEDGSTAATSAQQPSPLPPHYEAAKSSGLACAVLKIHGTNTRATQDQEAPGGSMMENGTASMLRRKSAESRKRLSGVASESRRLSPHLSSADTRAPDNPQRQQEHWPSEQQRRELLQECSEARVETNIAAKLIQSAESLLSPVRQVLADNKESYADTTPSMSPLGRPASGPQLRADAALSGVSYRSSKQSSPNSTLGNEISIPSNWPVEGDKSSRQVGPCHTGVGASAATDCFVQLHSTGSAGNDSMAPMTRWSCNNDSMVPQQHQDYLDQLKRPDQLSNVPPLLHEAAIQCLSAKLENSTNSASNAPAGIIETESPTPCGKPPQPSPSSPVAGAGLQRVSGDSPPQRRYQEILPEAPATRSKMVPEAPKQGGTADQLLQVDAPPSISRWHERALTVLHPRMIAIEGNSINGNNSTATAKPPATEFDVDRNNNCKEDTSTLQRPTVSLDVTSGTPNRKRRPQHQNAQRERCNGQSQAGSNTTAGGDVSPPGQIGGNIGISCPLLLSKETTGGEDTAAVSTDWSRCCPESSEPAVSPDAPCTTQQESGGTQSLDRCNYERKSQQRHGRKQIDEAPNHRRGGEQQSMSQFTSEQTTNTDTVQSPPSSVDRALGPRGPPRLEDEESGSFSAATHLDFDRRHQSRYQSQTIGTAQRRGKQSLTSTSPEAAQPMVACSVDGSTRVSPLPLDTVASSRKRQANIGGYNSWSTDGGSTQSFYTLGETVFHNASLGDSKASELPQDMVHRPDSNRIESQQLLQQHTRQNGSRFCSEGSRTSLERHLASAAVGVAGCSSGNYDFRREMGSPRQQQHIEPRELSAQEGGVPGRRRREQRLAFEAERVTSKPNGAGSFGATEQWGVDCGMASGSTDFAGPAAKLTRGAAAARAVESAQRLWSKDRHSLDYSCCNGQRPEIGVAATATLQTLLLRRGHSSSFSCSPAVDAPSDTTLLPAPQLPPSSGPRALACCLTPAEEEPKRWGNDFALPQQNHSNGPNSSVANLFCSAHRTLTDEAGFVPLSSPSTHFERQRHINYIIQQNHQQQLLLQQQQQQEQLQAQVGSYSRGMDGMHIRPTSGGGCVPISGGVAMPGPLGVACKVYSDDRDRMVYVSWIPKKARAYDSVDKRRMELELKQRLREDLNLMGLTKVLLFPPKGVHCKLIFDSRSSATFFMDKYGGENSSIETERWKSDVCAVYRIAMSDKFDRTVVKIEWSQK